MHFNLPESYDPKCFVLDEHPPVNPAFRAYLEDSGISAPDDLWALEEAALKKLIQEALNPLGESRRSLAARFFVEAKEVSRRIAGSKSLLPYALIREDNTSWAILNWFNEEVRKVFGIPYEEFHGEASIGRLRTRLKEMSIHSVADLDGLDAEGWMAAINLIRDERCMTNRELSSLLGVKAHQLRRALERNDTDNALVRQCRAWTLRFVAAATGEDLAEARLNDIDRARSLRRVRRASSRPSREEARRVMRSYSINSVLDLARLTLPVRVRLAMDLHRVKGHDITRSLWTVGVPYHILTKKEGRMCLEYQNRLTNWLISECHTVLDTEEEVSNWIELFISYTLRENAIKNLEELRERCPQEFLDHYLAAKQDAHFLEVLARVLGEDPNTIEAILKARTEPKVPPAAQEKKAPPRKRAFPGLRQKAIQINESEKGGIIPVLQNLGIESLACLKTLDEEALHALLKDLKLARGITRRKLRTESGASWSFIDQIEGGKKRLLAPGQAASACQSRRLLGWIVECVAACLGSSQSEKVGVVSCLVERITAVPFQNTA